MKNRQPYAPRACSNTVKQYTSYKVGRKCGESKVGYGHTIRQEIIAWDGEQWDRVGTLMVNKSQLTDRSSTKHVTSYSATIGCGTLISMTTREINSDPIYCMDTLTSLKWFENTSIAQVIKPSQAKAAVLKKVFSKVCYEMAARAEKLEEETAA